MGSKPEVGCLNCVLHFLIMNEYQARIYLQDEAPRIGSGWRTVLIKEGDKWAHLIDVASGRKQRIRIEVLDELRPGEQLW